MQTCPYLEELHEFSATIATEICKACGHVGNRSTAEPPAPGGLCGTEPSQHFPFQHGPGSKSTTDRLQLWSRGCKAHKYIWQKGRDLPWPRPRAGMGNIEGSSWIRT